MLKRFLQNKLVAFILTLSVVSFFAGYSFTVLTMKNQRTDSVKSLNQRIEQTTDDEDMLEHDVDINDEELEQ